MSGVTTITGAFGPPRKPRSTRRTRENPRRYQGRGQRFSRLMIWNGMDEAVRVGSGQVLQAPDDLEHVGPGVGIDVRVPGIGREAEAPGEGLPAEVRRGRDQERAHQGLHREAPRCPHQEDGAGAREEDHPVQEPQQAPGGLVGDRGIEDEHQERVEPQEAQDPRIRSGDSLRDPAGRAPDGRQHDDEALGPDGCSRGRGSGSAGAGSSPRGGSARRRRRPGPGRSRRPAPSPRCPGGGSGTRRRAGKTRGPPRGAPAARPGPARGSGSAERPLRASGPRARSARAPGAWSPARGAPSPSSRA